VCERQKFCRRKAVAAADRAPVQVMRRRRIWGLLAIGAVVAGIGAPPALEAQEADSVRTIRSGGGMVVSETAFASRAGADVLRAGGNAVDAAIAAGFALAVTHPAAGNIGGGGFMIIRWPDGRATALDFREKAPLASFPEMFLDEEDEYSYELHHESHRAGGVPGTVAGFSLAHERYGTVSWDELVQPGVELAREGFPVSERLAASLERFLEDVRGRYAASVEAFSDDGRPYEPGEILTQPDLARTLERIRDEGRAGFYEGETARLLAEEMERGGGLITREDLARYEPVEREPIRVRYKGYDVISMPPPSSGGVAIGEMLKILEGYDLESMGHGSADHFHLLAEAMRLAYRDRAAHLGDTDFVEVPIERLTSAAYAEELRATIRMDRAGRSDPSDLDRRAEGTHTTHYSVVDADGLAVSVTYTLEQGYGSGIVVPGAGFLLNNEMGDFNPRAGLTTRDGLIGTEANLVAPEKRMLSSMSPTILARDGALVAVTGSPGGRTIINTVLQMVLNVTEFELPPERAVAAPRVHHQWLPDVLYLEEKGAREDVVRELERRGHAVRVRRSQGLAHTILIDPETGERIGLPDPRNPDARGAGDEGGSGP